MKKLLIALISFIFLAAGAMMVVSRSTESPWTTSSAEAVEQYELGMAARMKLYGSEAAEHFARSLELDPEFAAAIVGQLEYTGNREEKDELLASLRSVELERLTPRERFMVSYALASEDEDSDELERLVEEYVALDPNDPYALATCSREAWEEQDWDRAERHYRKLLAADPHWVIAQNRLGYIAMATGRFAEAEELFETYKYIAPDQANPYDSLGELLTLVGRYEEARVALEQALAIKPDFCTSYQHLVETAVIAGRPAEGRPIIDRARAHCDDHLTESLSCEISFWEGFLEGDFDTPWREDMEPCLERLGETSFLVHRAALLSGRYEAADRAEDSLRGHIEEHNIAESTYFKVPLALLSHMEGVRQAVEGDLDAAAASFYKADDDLVFWGDGQGVLKLYNQLNLAWVLELAGDKEASGAIVDLVRDVNPQFAEDFRSFQVTFPLGKP